MRVSDVLYYEAEVAARPDFNGRCALWFQRSLTAASSIALILLRLHICHAHDVGKHTGSGDGGPRTVALNQHRIFVVAFCGKQDDIV